jgi:glycosyltransferase involved in cell wall biosynthesis
MSSYACRETEAFFGLTPGSAVPIHNPVALPPDLPSVARTRNQAVFTGTLTEKKGVVSLIKAWPAVRQRVPDAELHILGKDKRGPDGGSMRGYLESLLDERTKRSVHFHGHVDQKTLYEKLLSARVGVFPSYAETFGNAPVESMASGCPTIYTKRSCGPEIVRDDQDGILVDPDLPAEIAQALIAVLTDDKLAERLGTAGQQRALAEFSLGPILRRNEAWFLSCLSRFPRSR